MSVTSTPAPQPVPADPPAGTKPAPRGRRRLPRARWFVIPLLVLALGEGAARRLVHPASRMGGHWLMNEAAVKAAPVQYVFAGSSRVQAAVDVEVFAAAVGKEEGRPVRALNFGAGYSSTAEHYFNLRNLWEKYPEQMRGCTVFVEAPMGLPNRDTWDNSWADPNAPGLLVPVLRASDLPGLWATNMPTARKIEVTADYGLQPSVLLLNRQQCGRGLWGLGEGAFLGAAARFTGPRQQAAEATADLRAAGGIRTDEEAVAAARRFAVEYTNTALAHEEPGTEWERTILADLVRLVREAGGRVVLFDMPMHSIQAPMFQTPLRTRERDQLREKLPDWGCTSLSADFTYTDEDFPDFWHLRASRAAEFSRSLARAWRSAAPTN